MNKENLKIYTYKYKLPLGSGIKPDLYVCLNTF